MKYTYAVLQYRHDYWSGEVLNVGVLMHCPEARFLRLEARTAGGRILAAFPDLERRALTSDLKEIQRSFQRLEKDMREESLFFKAIPSLDTSASNSLQMISAHVIKHDASSIRWGQFGSGLSADPNATLEQLYLRYVMRYENLQSENRRDDEQIFEPVKAKLKDAGVIDRFEPHTVSTHLRTVEFKHSVKNGIWHCVQPLSFDHTTEEGMSRKASTWTGNLYHIREQKRDFKAYILAGRPTDRSLTRAYENALEMLRAAPTDPEVIEEADSTILVDRLIAIARSPRH